MLKKKNLLIVDDDPDYIYLLRRCLKGSGEIESIASAENGLQALDFFRPLLQAGKAEERPDIVLLDINMPVMNGFEFLREYELLIQSSPEMQSIQFFVISSSSSSQDMGKMAANSRVRKYLVKPLECETLLTEIGVA